MKAQEPVSILVDQVEHTDEFPFCTDPTCPDKQDQDAIKVVIDHVAGGLMTLEEAVLFTTGRTF